MGCSAGPNIVEDGLVVALDTGNTKSYQQNEIPEPTDMYGWYTTIKGDSNANQCTITRDTTTSSPVGNEPLKMVVTGTDPYLLSYNSSPWNLAPAFQGETWVVSVYVKASTNTSIQLFIFGGNSSGGVFSPTDYSAATINVTTEWKRYSYYRTFTQSATQYVHVRLDGPDTQSGGDATGQEVWWDGLQVERVPSGTTTPGSFNPNPKTFKDLSGRGNNGTLTNSPRRDFDNSGSLVFDGTDDQLSSVSIPNPNGELTCEVAMNYDSKGEYHNIFDRGSSRPMLWIDSNNKLEVSFSTASGGITSSDAYNGQDIVVTAVYNSNSSPGILLYVNGNLVGTQNTTHVTWTNPSTFTLFNRNNAQTFDGKLYYLKFYTKALTASEIKQNFNALRGRFGI
jgi:dipeptidyl aminopeptidase/acylaminoacyl peptidase